MPAAAPWIADWLSSQGANPPGSCRATKQAERIGHGLPVEAAIEHPRVHLEEPHVHCEGGADPAELDRLERFGYDVVRWRRRNLYFGGASAVEQRDDGSLAAAGDPRRGGHGVVVS